MTTVSSETLSAFSFLWGKTLWVRNNHPFNLCVSLLSANKVFGYTLHLSTLTRSIHVLNKWWLTINQHVIWPNLDSLFYINFYIIFTPVYRHVREWIVIICPDNTCKNGICGFFSSHSASFCWVYPKSSSHTVVAGNRHVSKPVTS